MPLAAGFGHVCIVGGGPAGLASAIALRLEGFEVTVADCAIPPIDKSCGEGLMPDSIAALQTLGIEIPEHIGYPLRGITFINEDRTLTGDFSSKTARGVRRTALHSLLVARAASLEIELIWGARVSLANRNTLFINGREHRPAYVVGADGQNSRIRRHADLSAVRYEQRRYGFRRHYQISPWSHHVQLYWGRQCQLYVTPVAKDEVGVALISNDPRLRLNQALQEFPELHWRLGSAPYSSKEMGSLTGSRTLRNVCRPGIALIGDASGSIDAITGEGMSLSFQQAISLARACKTGDLSEYEREHRRLRSRPNVMSGLMLLLARHQKLRQRTFASLLRRPEIFEQLLSVHIGEAPFKDLLSWRLLPWSAAFLTA